MKDSRIIVVGGGLAGLSLTALLGSQGITVTCIDRENPAETLKAEFDGRTTAISFGARQVLENAGVWDILDPDACPIKTIHILDGDSPHILPFDSAEVEDRAFGWIIENRLIRKALLERVAALGTAEHIAPAIVTDFSIDTERAAVHLADGRTINGALIIGADGRGSFTREWMGIRTRGWAYRQQAIVCIAAHENPHENIAVEHFRPAGPFAILPMTDAPDGTHRSSVVWTVHGRQKRSPLDESPLAFNAALQDHFPDFYGRVELSGRRFSYPLSLVHAHDYIAPRMALIAEAAHGIHPIAGQGLNMGFRDIAVLVGLIGEAVEQNKDPGAWPLLQSYQRQRRPDNVSMAGATDVLNRLFSNDFLPVRMARRMGLRAVANLPPAKKFFMTQAMGLGRY